MPERVRQEGLADGDGAENDDVAVLFDDSSGTSHVGTAIGVGPCRKRGSLASKACWQRDDQPGGDARRTTS